MKHELIETTTKKEDILTTLKENSIDKAILFCNKKRDIEAFVKLFKDNEYKAVALYNGLEDEVIAETVKTFNRGKKILLVCSDSVAKKVKLSQVNFIIGTELPTRANDYKVRLSYMHEEEGKAITFHNGEDADKLSEIDRVMSGKKAEKKPEQVKSKPAVAKETKKNTSAPSTSSGSRDNKKEKSSCFGGHIPAFLNIDISHLLKN